jgi:DNA-directed RNA polymerase beta subunit
MTQSMNYINALPDFLAMQRVSFCWFITQGLNEELRLFSKIYDFSQNTEYIMFGDEYNLIKPPYSLSIARKYSGNYRAQLVIPIEVRSKISNNICYQTQFPVVTLPLMTTYATFIINGCERVVVSQIIRSPGIYFEKNKNQKRQNQFRRKLSTDVNKLRTFLPSGEAFISEFDLFFSIPITTYDKIKLQKKLIPNWDKNLIYYYSIKSLKDATKNSSTLFLEYFKFYRSISKKLKSNSKNKLIQFFFKWLKLKTNINFPENILNENRMTSLLTYFQFLLKFLVKYELLVSIKSLSTNFKNQIIFIESLRYFKNSKNHAEKIFETYDELIYKSQISIQLTLNYKFIVLTKHSNNWFQEFNKFLFLTVKINKILTTLIEFNEVTKFFNFQPTIYFSVSLKDQLKYIFGKNKFIDKPERHSYLKTKTQLLLYRKDH